MFAASLPSELVGLYQLSRAATKANDKPYSLAIQAPSESRLLLDSPSQLGIAGTISSLPADSRDNGLYSQLRPPRKERDAGHLRDSSK